MIFPFVAFENFHWELTHFSDFEVVHPIYLHPHPPNKRIRTSHWELRIIRFMPLSLPTQPPQDSNLSWRPYGAFTPAIFSTIVWTLTFCVNNFCVHTCFVLYYFGCNCVVWLSQIFLCLHVLNSALNAVTCLCYCFYCAGIKMSAWYHL